MSRPQRSKLLRSLRQWKAKAVARREQVDALNKRVVELTHSRDVWKTKAQASQTIITALQAALRRGSRRSALAEKKRGPSAL